MTENQLYQWVGDPVTGPMPLVVVTDGWIEASEAMTRVHDTIAHQADLTPLVEFDTDQLVDHRSRRPVIDLVDGLMTEFHWPKLQLSLGTDNDDNPFLYLHGPEPDVRWRPFTRAVATIAESIGVTTMFTLAAYPVPAPHTRPVRISSAGTSRDLLAGRKTTTGAMTVPGGIQMAIAFELRDRGVETLGLYAQVPYYITTTPWPQASIGLIEHLHDVAGLRFDASMLQAQVPEAIAAVDSSLAESPPLASLVTELEERYDELRRLEDGDLPSGDELEEELQQFLRDQGD